MKANATMSGLYAWADGRPVIRRKVPAWRPAPARDTHRCEFDPTHRIAVRTGDPEPTFCGPSCAGAAMRRRSRVAVKEVARHVR